MAAPNIDMIAASLRNCSLNYQNTPSSSSSSSSSSSQPVPPPPPPPPTTGSSGDLTVELNSNIALPFHWEQCLDITTGQVYYINWETGTRTSNDPRTFSSHISSPESEYSESNECAFNEIYNSLNFDDLSSDTDTSNYTVSSVNVSNMSSFSPTESSCSSGLNGLGTGVETRPDMWSQVLVAAGCKSCFMYFMIPKFVDICPKCGGDGLLHLDR